MIANDIANSFELVRSSIESGPVYPDVTVTEIREHLAAKYDFQSKIPLDDVVADAEEMLRKWQVQVTHPRYFGLFNPSITLASVVADTLVAMYNSQLANWRTSPAANEIERHTLEWLAGKFGLPPKRIATFTSGGSEANLTAIVVALTKMFPGYGELGLQSLDKTPAFYLSEEAHNGYNKLAHITGLGRRAVRIVPTSADLKMDIGALESMVAQDRRDGIAPFMVVGTAGTTATGVIDPLRTIGTLCENEGLWFHADAAWGGAAILSQSLKEYLAGIEMADSITCDAHKWLSVSMGSGMFFCRHPDSVAQAFRTDITYMSGEQSGPVFDPLTHSIQWSRRFIGLKLFMALAEKGEAGYVEMIEHQANLGNKLRALLVASGWRIVNDTPLPLVCFTRDGLDVSKFLELLRERQVAWMSPAKVGGSVVVRACITNFATTEDHLRWVVDEMNQTAAQHCSAVACA
ncbi:MAG TPA: pyridoxal-dependent decarboxylase [Terriglobales bacterium]|nr:pyridoxal-dependent decarboxylase [Terriglobales bacterium]